jgi:mRNA interferase YafQ
MREIVRQTKFKADMKRVARTGKYDIEILIEVVRKLTEDAPLPPSCQDHALSGNWKGFRECHVKPDWLLIYKLDPGRLILVRTGTHGELFNK